MSNFIIRVIINNQPGALAEITKLLSEAFIDLEDIEAISFGDKGIIRLQTSNDQEASRILQEHGYQTASDEVVLVALTNYSGALAEVMESLARHTINVHSARVMDQTENVVCIMLTTDDPNRTREILKDYLL